MESVDLEQFEVKIIEKDGKKFPVVQCRAETIVHPDGRKDVIIHAPALALINKAIEQQEKN